MFEKLESLEKRYRELEELLADQKVISDFPRYQKLSQEFSRLSTAVKKFGKYREITRQILEVESLLKKKNQDKELVELASQEYADLEEKRRCCEVELADLLLSEDPDVHKDIIVEIRAGTGGAEAALFAGDLYRMYNKYALKKGWTIEVMDSRPTETGGFKEIIFSLKGEDVYRRFKHESGVHRVQRVPITEASGRIHTSAATVAVLPEAEDVEVSINPRDLRIDVFRSTGPGGQGVNTTDSAVRITHLPTGTVVSCQDERSQLKNKLKAMRVLKARLLDMVRREQMGKISEARKSQIGTGDRSQKIRTYNFPDRRITDHRIGLTLHKLEGMLEGDLDELTSALMAAERKARLETVDEPDKK